MRRSDNPVIRMCRENLPRRRNYLRIFTVVFVWNSLISGNPSRFLYGVSQAFCPCGLFFRLCFEWCQLEDHASFHRYQQCNHFLFFGPY